MLIIKLVLKIINAILAFILAVAFASVYVPPAYLPYINALGLLVPVLLAFNIFFVILWLLCKDMYFLYSVMAIAVGWGQWTGVFSVGADKDTTDTPTLRLMTYNVMSFYGQDGRAGEQVSTSVNNTLDVYSPDVICFQEYRHFPDVNLSEWKYSYRDKNVALYSRYPIINKGSLSFDDTFNNAVYADVKLSAGDTVRVYCVHLESLEIRAGEVKALSTSHDLSNDVKGLWGRLNSGFITQGSQVKKVVESIKNSPYPVVVAGDFNNTPFSYSYHSVLQEGLKDAFREAGWGIGATFRDISYPLRIDHIMVDEMKFGVQSCDVLRKEKSSDHYPVFAVFTLK
ncbi:MAG: endonuclease/exonuclease/phosphatase family protein [Flavobacteriales bacterium]|nr:endonuclease/exonuclease/phosphatase family protein [Flavobacteriales bacterium]